MIRIVDIIIIEIGYILARRSFQPCIAGRRKTLISLMLKIDNVASLIQQIYNRLNIGTSIVHNNNLNGAISLSENAGKRLFKHVGAVTGGHDNAHKRVTLPLLSALCTINESCVNCGHRIAFHYGYLIVMQSMQYEWFFDLMKPKCFLSSLKIHMIVFNHLQGLIIWTRESNFTAIGNSGMKDEITCFQPLQ